MLLLTRRKKKHIKSEIYRHFHKNTICIFFKLQNDYNNYNSKFIWIYKLGQSLFICMQNITNFKDNAFTCFYFVNAQ